VGRVLPRRRLHDADEAATTARDLFVLVNKDRRASSTPATLRDRREVARAVARTRS